MAKKNRLVWTDDVMSFLCKRCNEMYPDEPCEPSDCLMLEELDKCKTVDAVEVVRGRWDEIEEEVWHLYKRWPITRFRCSQCKQMENKKSNYCPNCGADMRERKDNG